MIIRIRQAGFTIVELLIVIVVIGILAVIVTVGYRGVQDRANDTLVQTDLKNAYNKIKQYQVINDAVPFTDSELASLKLRFNKDAYGLGYKSAHYYNVVYCTSATELPKKIAIVAQSKSGSVFQMKDDGSVTKADYPQGASVPTCANAGVDVASDTRVYFRDRSIWQSYISG